MGTVLDAVAKVLEASDKPLHYQEIADQIIEQGLWSTESSTPQNTVAASLSLDLRDKGDQSRFVKTSRGYFGLRKKVNLSTIDTQAGAQEGLEEKLSFSDAAEAILEQSGKQEPIHYDDITKQILSRKLITTKSKSPATTLYASIIQENRRVESQGETPRFTLHGRGMIGLTKWMPKGIEAEIHERNEGTREDLLARVKKMRPEDFEKLISVLLVRLGFIEVETTRHHGDKGIDVRGTLAVGGAVRIRLAVQVKRYDQNIQAPEIQNLRGSLGAHEQGLFITTSDYGTGAKTDANRPDAAPIGLINGKQLVGLLVEHRMGIGVKRLDLYETVDLSVDDLQNGNGNPD